MMNEGCLAESEIRICLPLEGFGMFQRRKDNK